MQQNYEHLLLEFEKLKAEYDTLRTEIKNNFLYSKIYQNSAIGMFICDKNGFFVDTNKEFSNIVGYTCDELKNISFREFTPKEDLEKEVQNIRKLISNEVNQIKYEKKFISKLNEIVWVSLSISILRDENNNPKFFLGTCENITDKKILEENLNESNRNLKEINILLQAVLNGIPDIIGIQDKQHQVIQYNKAGYDFLNKDYEQVVGKKCFNLMGREKQCDVCSTADCIKSKKIERHEQYFPEFNIWFDARSYPILDENNEIKYVIEHLRDITEQKQLQFELKERERVLKTLFSNLPGMAYRCLNTPKWDMIIVSDGAFELTGYTPDQLIKNQPAFGDIILEEHQQRIWDEVQQAVFKKERYELYYRIKTADNKIKHVWERAKGIFNEKEELIYIEGFIEDISERVEMELKIIENEAELKTQNEEYLAINEELNQTNQQLIKAKNIAEDSEKKYRLIFEKAPVGLFKYDEKGIIIECNDNFVKIIGSSREKLIGLNMTILPDKKLVDALNKSLKGESGYYNDYYNSTTAQKTTPVIVIFTPIIDKNNYVVGGVGIVQDITEIKNYELELKKQNEEYILINEQLQQKNQELYIAKSIAEEKEMQLKLISDSIPDAMIYQKIVSDNQTRIFSYVSNNVEKFYGCKPDDVYKNSNLIYDRIHQQDKQELIDAQIDALENMKILKKIVRMYNPDGTIRWSMFVSNPRKTDGGVVWDGLEIDITQQKEMENKLMEAKDLAEKNEKQFRKLFENMQQGFALHEIILDDKNEPVDYKFIMVNDAFYKLTRQDGKNVIGKRVKEIYPNIEKSWIKNYGRVAQTGVVLNFEGYTKEFNKYYDIVAYSPQKGYFATIFTDITKNKKYEKQLMKAKAKAMESEKLKTSFLHNISHEIRTPLNAICGFSEFLKDENLTQQKRTEFADIIIKSGYQLTSIIDDIVSISSIESGLVKAKYKKFNLNELIEEIYAIFLHKAEKKNINFILNTPNFVINHIISDKTKLNQIISNLITNALKFTQTGSIEIGYNLKEKNIEFYVKDSGIGIDKEAHSKIFERFQQANSSISNIYGGTGLGLSIAKAYTELLGGKIWVNSELGKGTTFYFTIPFVENYEQIFRYNALLVEDNKETIEIIKDNLLESNINVLIAQNEVDAIVSFEDRNDIDIVFFSLKTYNNKQFEAMKQILQKNKSIPLIVFTEKSYDEEQNEVIELGAKEYIQLPIRPYLIQQIVDKYLPFEE